MPEIEALFDALAGANQCDVAERVLGQLLFAAGVWKSPRTSDGS